MFPTRNSAKSVQLHFITVYTFRVDCVHYFGGSKYSILLQNLFGRDANLVLLAAFQNLRKTLEPYNLFDFKILKFVYIHWKYPALANLKYVTVKVSELNSIVRTALFACSVISVRAVLFMCVQCYLSGFNAVYSEVSNKRPPAYYLRKI